MDFFDTPDSNPQQNNAPDDFQPAEETPDILETPPQNNKEELNLNFDNNANNNFTFPEDNQNFMSMNNKADETAPLDEEEQKRIEARENEMRERRKKIEEKISSELKEKEERRNKAVEFMNEFENKRINAISLRKEANKKNELEYQENKNSIKDGSKNPWELVTDNITIKDSEYKGSKDITRMRSAILARKNDVLIKK